MYTSVEGGSVKVWCFRNSWPKQIRIHFLSQSNGNIDLYRIQGFLVRESLYVCSRYWTKDSLQNLCQETWARDSLWEEQYFLFPWPPWTVEASLSENLSHLRYCLLFWSVSGYFKKTLVVLKVLQKCFDPYYCLMIREEMLMKATYLFLEHLLSGSSLSDAQL